MGQTGGRWPQPSPVGKRQNSDFGGVSLVPKAYSFFRERHFTTHAPSSRDRHLKVDKKPIPDFRL